MPRMTEEEFEEFYRKLNEWRQDHTKPGDVYYIPVRIDQLTLFDIPNERKRRYDNYIKSLTWKRKREAALSRAKYKCEFCGAQYSGLEVHHKSYDRLGAETPSDLIVLCPSCHKRFHQPAIELGEK